MEKFTAMTVAMRSIAISHAKQINSNVQLLIRALIGRRDDAIFLKKLRTLISANINVMAMMTVRMDRMK